MRKIVLCLAIALAATGSVRAGEARTYEWPLYKGSSGFAGTSADASVKPPLKLLWTYRTDGDATGEGGNGLIVADGKVFVSLAMERSILALDALTGDFLWEAGDGISGRMAAAYHEGRLFAWTRSAAKSELHALDAGTGREVWRFSLPTTARDFSQLRRWGVTVHDGKVLFSRGGKEPLVVAIDARSGEEVWRTRLPSEHGAVVIPPSAAGGRVFVGVRAAIFPRNEERGVGATLALNISDGTILWKRTDVFPWLPLSTDGRVVTCAMHSSLDTRFYLLDAQSGKTLWSTTKKGRYPATLTDRFVLMKDYGPNFTALDRRTGKEVWTFRERGASGCCTPTVAGRFAFFGTGAPAVGGLGWAAWSFGPARQEGRGYNFYAVDLDTGKAVWKFPMGMNVCADPAIAYGRVYASGMDGRVYCFGPAQPGEPTVPAAKESAPAVPASEIRALLTPSEPAAAASAWPMAGGTPQRSGITGIALKPPLELAWKSDTGGRVQISPALVGGTVYIGSDAGAIHAIEGASGRTLWKFQTGGKIRCAPAVAGDLVYCGSDDGTLYALQTRDGKPRWTFKAAGAVRASPAVVADVLVFTADDHNLYALDRRTGRKLWNYRAGYFALSAPPVVHGNQVFAAEWVNWVFALDLLSGELQWRSYVPRSVEGLALYRDKLWVRGCSSLVELDPGTGKRLRVTDSASYGANNVSFSKNVMIVAGMSGGTRYDLDDAGREPTTTKTLEDVRRLSPQSLRGASRLASVVTPLVLDQHVCFATRDRALVLTEPDGAQVWRFEMGGTCHSSPVSDGKLLVVGCDDGNVYAFREKTGQAK